MSECSVRPGGEQWVARFHDCLKRAELHVLEKSFRTTWTMVLLAAAPWGLPACMHVGWRRRPGNWRCGITAARLARPAPRPTLPCGSEQAEKPGS